MMIFKNMFSVFLRKREGLKTQTLLRTHSNERGFVVVKAFFGFHVGLGVTPSPT